MEVVRYLIERAGVSPGHRGRGGTTPLHAAARGGHVEVAKYLVDEKGVDPSYEDEHGRTPLDCAQGDDIRKFLSRKSQTNAPKVQPSGEQGSSGEFHIGDA
jgi:ankyrin repeat protein